MTFGSACRSASYPFASSVSTSVVLLGNSFRCANVSSWVRHAGLWHTLTGSVPLPQATALQVEETNMTEWQSNTLPAKREIRAAFSIFINLFVCFFLSQIFCRAQSDVLKLLVLCDQQPKTKKDIQFAIERQQTLTFQMLDPDTIWLFCLFQYIECHRDWLNFPFWC